MSVVIRATVLASQVDPFGRDRLSRWLVRLRVDEVLAGSLAAPELDVLVHSPSRTFRDPDPVGSTYLLALEEPIADPYAGSIELRRG